MFTPYHPDHLNANASSRLAFFHRRSRQRARWGATIASLLILAVVVAAYLWFCNR